MLTTKKCILWYNLTGVLSFYWSDIHWEVGFKHCLVGGEEQVLRLADWFTFYLHNEVWSNVCLLSSSGIREEYHKPSNQLHKETAVKTLHSNYSSFNSLFNEYRIHCVKLNEDLSDSSLRSVLARNRFDWVTEREERPTLTVNIANIALRALQIKIDQTQSLQPSSVSTLSCCLPPPLPPSQWPKTLTKTLCVRRSKSLQLTNLLVFICIRKLWRISRQRPATLSYGTRIPLVSVSGYEVWL